MAYHNAFLLLINGPAARVNHGSARLIEQATEFWISCVHVNHICITPIQFDVVDVPIGECLCIDFHVIDDTWISGACVRSIVFINAEFQPFAVNLSENMANNLNDAIKYATSPTIG